MKTDLEQTGDDTTVTTELERSLRSRFSAASKARFLTAFAARLKPNTVHLSRAMRIVKSIRSGLSRARITGNFV